MKVEVAVLRSPYLISLVVSVDVKQHCIHGAGYVSKRVAL